MFICSWEYLHLCCQGITQTCYLLWPACVCVFHLPALKVSVASEIWLCRLSDHPDSLVDEAPHDHYLGSL